MMKPIVRPGSSLSGPYKRADEWIEGNHERAPDGKFGSGSGSSKAAKSKKVEELRGQVKKAAAKANEHARAAQHSTYNKGENHPETKEHYARAVKSNKEAEALFEKFKEAEHELAEAK